MKCPDVPPTTPPGMRRAGTTPGRCGIPDVLSATSPERKSLFPRRPRVEAGHAHRPQTPAPRSPNHRRLAHTSRPRDAQ